jgi:outer membrane cobalamin receptor
VEWQISRHLLTTVDLFRNNVKDLIERKGRGYTYSNLDQVILQGVETGMKWSVTGRFDFSIDYAYLDAYEQNTEYWLAYRPSHKVDYSVTFLLKSDLSVYLSGQYVSRRVTPHPESELLSPYFVTNLKLSQKIFNRFHPFIEIKNLFDENYEEEKGFPMPGRTSLAGMKVTI